MKILFAVDSEGMLAPTLGTAAFLLVQQGSEYSRIPIGDNLPASVLNTKAEILFCGGIGMCLLSLLESGGMTVLPGCSGMPQTLFQQWKDGILPQRKGYLCSDHGRTCGSCPGKY